MLMRGEQVMQDCRPQAATSKGTKIERTNKILNSDISTSLPAGSGASVLD